MTIILKVGEIGRVLTGKTPKTSSSSFWDGDIPFYTPSDMDGRRRLDRVKRYITNEGLKSVKNSTIPPNSVMVSCIGSDMGKVSLNLEHGVTNQQINTVVPDPEIVDYHYLYYSFLPRKAELQMLASGGSAQPILNKGQFSQIELSIPPLKEQKAIAHILGTLDDKIELNQKMNQTLEDIAKAIFKSWFVDFDPVRAKAEGRPTGLPAEISDLFPDAFEDSEIGEIPKGWEIGALGDLFDIQYGKNLPKNNMTGEGYPVFGANGVIGFHSTYLYEEPMTLIGCRGVAGNVGRSLPKSFVTNNSLVINHERARLTSQRFIEFVLASGETESYVTGSAQPQLTIEKIKDFPFITPPSETVNYFQAIVNPLADRQLLLDSENQVLSELRETLLPKLISGELRIPDAEKFLEEAGI